MQNISYDGVYQRLVMLRRRMFWLSGAQPSNWEQSAQPGDQEERWLPKYRGGGEIIWTWNLLQLNCTIVHTCRSPVWKWFMIRRLTRWRLPFRNHTIDICHHFEFLNLDETVYVIRGSHYRIDICHYFEFLNSIWCHQGISQQYNQLRVASDGLMVENEEMRGNIMRRFEDENIECGDEWDMGENDAKVGTALFKFLQ